MFDAKRLAGIAGYSYAYSLLSKARTVGLGTGSTIKYFIEAAVEEGILRGKIIYASSIDTIIFLEEKDLHASPPHLAGKIDVYIDGLDEVDNKMNIVKGRGAALHWEKQLALRAGKRIYIGDHTKYNGRNYLYLKPIPVEVSPPSLTYTLRQLARHGIPKLRRGKAKDGPILTDSGNYIVDLFIDRIDDPGETDREIGSINGVIETGIFPESLVDTVVIAYPDGRIMLMEK